MVSSLMREYRNGHIILGRYEMLEKIGRGGFSTVYRAYDHKMDRHVAIKALHGTEELSGRATREARAAAKLNHSNIVTVFELSEDEDNIYLVSELVEGEALANLISSVALSDRESLTIALQVLDALGHAHSRGVVHRDIKPDNIMLSSGRNLEAKVMDFGIAQLENTQRITRQGDVVGTLAYMSPEQADGQTVDENTDVYSTALTLYECLTGSNPFRAATAAETLGKIHAGAPPLSYMRPDLPRELSDLLDEAMETDPSTRLGRASLAAGIEGMLPGFADEARATTVLRRQERPAASFLSAALDRFGFLFPRLINTGLAALIAWAAVFNSSLYPASWQLPLVAATALLVSLLPRAGLLALAGVTLAPVAVFSPALGAIATLAAVAYFFAIPFFKPETALLPAAAAGLGYLGIGLTYPSIAGVAGRLRRGLLLALLGAFALTYMQLFTGATTLDYTGSPNSFSLPSQLEGEYNPVQALEALATPFMESPVMALQPLVWLMAALPAALLVHRRSRYADLSGLVLANSVLLAGYAALPLIVTGYELPLVPFLKTFALCAIIQFGLLMISPRARRQPSSLNERA